MHQPHLGKAGQCALSLSAREICTFMQVTVWDYTDALFPQDPAPVSHCLMTSAQF